MPASEESASQRPDRLRALGRTLAAVRRMSGFFLPSRGRTVLLVALSVVAGIVEAVLLALIASVATSLSQDHAPIVLHLGPGRVHAGLETAFLVALGLALLRGGLQLVLAYLPARMSADAMVDLRRRLFDSFVRASWPAKANERDGQFQSLMNMHITSTYQAITYLAAGITAALMFVTLLVSAFVLSLTAALILSVASGALFFSLRPLSRRLRKSAKALSAENIEYSKGVQEIVLMAEEAEVFGASPTYRSTFYKLVEGVRAPLLRTRFLSGAVPALYQSVALVVLVVALIAVSFVPTSQIASLGAVVLVLLRSLTYGQQVQTSITGLDERIPFMERLAEALEHYGANPQQDGTDDLSEVRTLGLADVSYAYPGGRTVLHRISFEAHRGEAVGIVGPSGAGKSSIVQLLLRLRDPDEGAVLVNGRDARGVRRAEWQRAVAYVPQNPQLIWGTVADNIRFFRPYLTDEAVEAAARRAQIHDEILSWPDGYRTVIGQRAAAISGGQRQRICLARALADGPEVLILDEPTSALDVRSEERVQDSIRGLRGDVLVLLVAHRLSTLAVCDRVVVVVNGRVEAIDATDALMESSDFFREVAEITRRSSAL